MELSSIIEFILRNEYGMILFFFASLIVGLPVILPILFAAVHGTENLLVIVGITFFSALLSDVIWYYLGAWSKQKKVEHYIGMRWVLRRLEKFSWFGELYDAHALKLIFISRFVYGTKNVSAFLSGRGNVRFLQHFFICCISMLAWLFLIIGLAAALQDLARLTNAVYGIRVSFAIFIATIILSYTAVGYAVKGRAKEKIASPSQAYPQDMGQR